MPTDRRSWQRAQLMVAAHTEAPQLPGLSARERVALLRILAVSSIDDATIEPRRAAALENYARVLVSGPADHRAVVVAAQRLIAVWAPARPAPVVVRSTHAPAPSSQVHPKLMRAEAALAEEPKRRPIFAAFLEVAESGATEPMSPYHLAAVCAAHARPQSRALPRAVSGR